MAKCVKDSRLAGSGEALLVIDMQVGFDEICWVPRNSPVAEMNAGRPIQRWRFRGRHLVVAPSDPLDEQDRFRVRHPARFQECARYAKSPKSRPLKPGLY